MESLHPRVRVVWLLGALVPAAVVGVAAVAVDRFLVALPSYTAPLAALLVFAVGVVYVVAHYRIWRYEVREDALYIERGVFTRVKSVVPFVRVQHVDSQRGPVERTAGLASVVVYTAGSRGADVTIPGLTPDRAEALQDRLRRLAGETETGDAV